MVAQNRCVFDKFQLAFWQLIVLTLMKIRMGIYWIKGHFLGIMVVLIVGIMLAVITSTIAYGQISNFPFLDLMREKNQPIGNYMVILFDDFTSPSPKFQTAWMVFQTDQPQPMKILKLVDSTDMTSILGDMDPQSKQTLPLDLNAWLDEQGVDMTGYVLADYQGLTAFLSAANGNENIDFRNIREIVPADMLNRWCSLYKNTNNQNRWELINRASANGHLIFNDASVIDLIFSDEYGSNSGFSTPICQVIN